MLGGAIMCSLECAKYGNIRERRQSVSGSGKISKSIAKRGGKGSYSCRFPGLRGALHCTLTACPEERLPLLLNQSVSLPEGKERENTKTVTLRELAVMTRLKTFSELVYAGPEEKSVLITPKNSKNRSFLSMVLHFPFRIVNNFLKFLRGLHSQRSSLQTLLFLIAVAVYVGRKISFMFSARRAIIDRDDKLFILGHSEIVHN